MRPERPSWGSGEATQRPCHRAAVMQPLRRLQLGGPRTWGQSRHQPLKGRVCVCNLQINQPAMGAVQQRDAATKVRFEGAGLHQFLWWQACGEPFRFGLHRGEASANRGPGAWTA